MNLNKAWGFQSYYIILFKIFSFQLKKYVQKKKPQENMKLLGICAREMKIHVHINPCT